MFVRLVRRFCGGSGLFYHCQSGLVGGILRQNVDATALKAVFIEANILLFAFAVGVLSLPLLLCYALSGDGVSVFPPLFSITFLLLSAKLPITFVLFATSTTELFTNKIVTIAVAENGCEPNSSLDLLLFIGVGSCNWHFDGFCSVPFAFLDRWNML